MSKKRSFVKKHFMNFCICGSVVSFLFLTADTLEKRERMAAVPFEVRNELYYSDILDDNDYFSTYGRYTSSGCLLRSATETDSLLDKYVTYEKLKELKSLEIHMKNTENLEFLDNCPNIETLYIDDAEMLNENDIDYINNSKIKKVFLTFDYENLVSTKENKFDVSRIKKEVIINNCFYSYTRDLEQVTIYNYLTNYDPSMFADYNSYKNAKEIDDYLNKVIDKYKINEGKDDLEKVVLISNYICNSLEYDKNISKKIDKYLETLDDEGVHFYKADSKTKDYNYYSISSVINQEDEVKQAVCVNYASLFDIMCYKVGIKSRIVDGLNKNVHLGHAWNVVYIDDKKIYVDLTFYDSLAFGDDFLTEYFDTRNEFTYNVVKDNLIRDLDIDYANYSLYTDIEDLDKKTEKTSIYTVNEGLDGVPVINKDMDIKNFSILFLLGGIASFIPNKKYIKRKILKK